MQYALAKQRKHAEIDRRINQWLAQHGATLTSETEHDNAWLVKAGLARASVGVCPLKEWRIQTVYGPARCSSWSIMSPGSPCLHICFDCGAIPSLGVSSNGKYNTHGWDVHPDDDFADVAIRILSDLVQPQAVEA
jgi:hypothetical protein